MMRRFYLLCVQLVTVLFILLPLSAGAAASSSILDPGCASAPNSPVCQDAGKQGTKNPISGPNGIIQKAANILAMVAGIAAVLLIVFGGISYATSGGDSEKAKRARTNIINSAIGLVVIALAWVITSFVIQHVISS